MMLGRRAIGLISSDIVVTLSNAQQVVLSSLFTPAEWASARPKRVIIPAGVTIGSTDVAVPAMRTGTGWGGLLTIINAGNIEGAGGAANSGNGGAAFKAEANGGNKPKLFNLANIFGGGGGGGIGGQGGLGSYGITVYEGPYFNGGSPLTLYQYSTAWSGLTKVIWFGSVLYDAWDGGRTSINLGGVTYYLSTWQYGENYAIGRYYPSTASQAGGLAGNGGRGQGYAQSAANGSPGATGINNAGSGGAGGNGGARGANGATGNTGASGNAGAGVAGTAGGLAGYGIENPSDVDLVNTGSVLGR